MLNSSHFNSLNTAFLMKLLKSRKMYLLGIEKVKINILTRVQEKLEIRLISGRIKVH